MTKSIKAECEFCNGTGIRYGLRVRATRGAGIECDVCGGKGYKIVVYTPFRRLKEHLDVLKVYTNADEPNDFGFFNPEVRGGTDYEDWWREHKDIECAG